MNEEKIKTLNTEFEIWSKKRTGWNINEGKNNYELQLDYYKKIKKNVPKIVKFYNNLKEEQKEKLANKPVVYYIWKAYKDKKLKGFDELVELTNRFYEDSRPKDKNNYFIIQKELLKGKVSEEFLQEWREKSGKEGRDKSIIFEKNEGVSAVDYFLSANKEFYSELIGNEDLPSIIDIIVETLRVNATINARGANKKCINEGNGLKSLFEAFTLIYNFDLEKFTEKTKNLLKGLDSIAFEVFGFFNLDKGGYIYNHRWENFFNEFYVEKINVRRTKRIRSSLDIKEEYADLRTRYESKFGSNLPVEVINRFLADQNLSEERSFEERSKNIQIGLQIDQFIYDWNERHKHQKIGANNKGEMMIDNKGENKMSDEQEKFIKKAVKELEKKKQIILYGPAGTGKTWSVKKLVESFSKESYDDLKNTKPKRVEFITFHQSVAYEEFIEGIKPKTDGEGKISYDLEDGIFKTLSKRAGLNWSKSKCSHLYGSLLNDFSLEIDSIIRKESRYVLDGSILIDEVNFTEDREFMSFTLGGSVASNQRLTKKVLLRDLPGILDGSINSAKDIKPSFESKSLKHGNAPYYFKVLKKIKDFYSNNKSDYLYSSEKEKPYFLVIDEINRGNISKIFGELITLLESDKRLGKDDELTTTLPYSKEEFGIPPNLYIIGTMNTSDKSLAQIDLALRRRFGFIEKEPKYKLLSEKNPENESALTDFYKDKTHNIDLGKLLEQLNLRIEYLLDKDHLIGHSYFVKVSSIENLKNVFYNEIIPLLEEYFYGDYTKLKKVLGTDFVKKKDLLPPFADLDFVDDSSKLLEVKKLPEDEFIAAILRLINPKNVNKENQG